MSFDSSNVSADLIWEVTRSQNAFLVKRNTSGGVQFSRDPLNLTNKHSRKYAGFVNEKAVGITSAGEKGGVSVITKKQKSTQTPAKSTVKHTYGGKSQRKTYKGIVNTISKNQYRPDLRAEAVARASHVLRAQRPVKAEPEVKLRGAKAKKAAAAKEE